MEKRNKREVNWKYWFIEAIRTGFKYYGRLIGTFPLIFVAGTVIISIVLTCGLYYATFMNDIRFGYTPDNAPSRHEFAVYREYFDIKKGPFGSQIMIQAKDGGSLLREKHLDAVEEFRNSVLNFTISTTRIANYSYRTSCEPRCHYNFAVPVFKKGLELQRERILQGKDLSSDIILDFPKMEYYGRKIDIFNNFFDLKINESARNLTGTSIQSCSLIVLSYLAMESNETMLEAEKTWALALFDYANNMDSPYINVYVIGDTIGNKELMRAGIAMVPYFLGGWMMMFLFVFFAICFSAVYYHKMNVFTPVLAFVAVLSPILAMTTTIGAACLLGQPINALMMIIPFLVVSIGVDDAFLMLHCWQRLGRHDMTNQKVPQKMGFVFSEIGPSIGITSITNSLCFTIGVFAPIPQLRTFCLVTAIAMFMDFIFELTLFAPVLAWIGRREKASATEPKWLHLDVTFRKLCWRYSVFLTTWTARLLAVIFLGSIWTIGLLGIMKMKATFEAQKSFSTDSIVHSMVQLHKDYVLKQRQRIFFFVNSPPNVTDFEEFNRFKGMVNDLETSPRTLGPDFTTLWLRDYESWVTETKFEMDWLGFEDDSLLSYDDVPYFMETEQNKLVRVMVKWNQTGQKTTVDCFFFSLAYGNMSDWLVRVGKQIEVREILSKYPEFNTTMWELNSSLFDLSIMVRSITYFCIIITMICMAVVCLFFVPNISCVLVAICAIGSICISALGMLSWWGVDLDPLTMVNMFPSIGFSVDYTAHIVYHYHRASVKCDDTKSDRLRKTFHSVAIPMIQAGLSTLICVSLLGFIDVYVFIIFLKMIIFVVSLGLIHGLFIVPVVLTSLPGCLTGTQEFDGSGTFEEHPLKIVE